MPGQQRKEQGGHRGGAQAALTLAGAAVGGVPVVARDAGLTVPARGQVLTLLTDALVHAPAVPVALASCGDSRQPD